MTLPIRVIVLYSGDRGKRRIRRTSSVRKRLRQGSSMRVYSSIFAGRTRNDLSTLIIAQNIE